MHHVNRKHEITLQDIEDAMKNMVLLASSANSRTHKAKDLKFCPYDLTYYVRYFDGETEHEKEFPHNPMGAIEQYNEFDA